MSDSHKRLAVFIPSLRGGGAERVMLNLAIGFATCGTRVDLVIAQSEGPFLTEVPTSIRLIELKQRRLLSSLPRLVGYLRRERPDAMISSMMDANVIALWARLLARTPTSLILTEHLTLSGATAQNWRGRLIPHLAKYFYPLADGVVAVSKDIGAELIEMLGIPPERVHVIYNPVVTPALQQKAGALIEHPWFAPGQPPVLLAVGRLVPQKDFATLIRAFAHVRLSQRARLVILGEGADRPMLEALITQLGLGEDVQLPGFVANPYAYMSRSRLVVLSSRWEGLPTVLIEGLYCGASVVSTDCPSGPREILDKGRYGHLVPVGDDRALARAIEAALSSTKTPPPYESWQRFRLETAVANYHRLLFGS